MSEEWDIPCFADSFVKGDFEIIKKPFVPKRYETYFFVTTEGNITNTSFDKTCVADLYNIEHGNCYRTSKEAENNIEKHMKQFAKIIQKVGIE